MRKWSISILAVLGASLGLFFLTQKEDNTAALRDWPGLENRKATDGEPTVKPWRVQLHPNNQRKVAPANTVLLDAANDKSGELPLGALEGERTISFVDPIEKKRFLALAIGEGFEIRGLLDGLNAVRVGLGSADGWHLLERLSKNGEVGFNFPVATPRIPQNPKDQPNSLGGIGFGTSALQAIGIETPLASWGRGLRIGILDNGIRGHEALNHTRIEEVNLLGEPPVSGVYDGHGTAVASLIAGQSGLVSGVAPGVDLLSVRVLNEQGQGDAFTVAQGIVEAVDRGVQIISMSLGAYGDSAVLSAAVDYATSKGVLLVASVGNDGMEGVTFPAAYPEVLAVGAIDAQGQPASFSNRAAVVDMAAPGVALNAAWSEQRHVSFSGTSAAAPMVAGSIAALMSQNPGMGSQEAATLLLENTNEAGLPGIDNYTGTGALNLMSALHHSTPNRQDLGLGFYATPVDEQPLGNDQQIVELYVQNRGTMASPAANLQLEVAGSLRHISIPSLQPRQSKIVEIQTPRIETVVELSATIKSPLLNDANDLDNTARLTLPPVESP